MKNEIKTMDIAETNGTANETDNKNSSSNELVEKIEIENTPFTAIRADEKWFLTMGKYRLTPPLKNKEEALAAGVDESWWRIMQVINIMITEHEAKGDNREEFKNINKLEGTIQKKLNTK